MLIQYLSWGIFILTFLASYSLLSKVLLSFEERSAIANLFGSKKQKKPKQLYKKNLSKKKKSNKKKKRKIPTLDDFKGDTFEEENLGKSKKENDDAILEDTKSNNDKSATLSLMKFLEGSISNLLEGNIKIGAADRFGLNLYIAGACEVIKRANSLTYDQFVELLKVALSLIGNKASAAKKLADQYEEYLLEPQYISIFQAGSEALEKFNKGDQKALEHIKDCLDQWRNPKKDDSPSEGPISVMFTDIVGSTKLTQELGDEGAQKVLRVHNAIVRVALKDFQGKEVKHTGDGIMARFSKSNKAVESALIIIKVLKTHNSESPELPLHIRIGINAGEPIIEENDLFGSTVQMAARICDAADTDKILVSNIIRELSQGKSINFNEAGKYAMKGIEGPVTLYEPIRK